MRYRVKAGSVTVGLPDGGTAEHGPGAEVDLEEAEARRLLGLGVLEEYDRRGSLDEQAADDQPIPPPDTPANIAARDEAADEEQIEFIVAKIDELPDDAINQDGTPNRNKLKAALGRPVTNDEIDRAIEIYVARSDEDD